VVPGGRDRAGRGSRSRRESRGGPVPLFPPAL